MKRDEINSKVYTPEDIAAMLAIGLTSVYELLQRQSEEHEFRVLRIGKLYRIECESFDSWLSMNA